MSTEAAQTTEAAADAATQTTPAVEAKPPDGAAAKPAEKPAEEAPKQPWKGALAAERKAREAAAKAKEEASRVRTEYEARAKADADKLAAKEKELATALAEIGPFREALTKKDAKALLAAIGMGPVDLAQMVAEDGKAPSAEELVARAKAEALEDFKAEQKKRDDEAAEARKKQDEAARKAAEDAQDQKFVKSVTRELEGAVALLGSTEHAEKFALANALDKVLPAIGLDSGSTPIEWGENSDGSPRTVTVKGGSPIARAATSLVLKILNATVSEPGGPTRIPMAEAIERVQKAALAAEPRLQQLAELPKSDGKTDKKNDQKKNGGAAQPTLSTKATTGPVVEAIDEDRSSLVDARAVRRAAIAALPHLRQHFTD